MLKRVDAFCECGHKVLDMDPRYKRKISGLIKCSECDRTTNLRELTYKERDLTEQEKVRLIQAERISLPYGW